MGTRPEITLTDWESRPDGVYGSDLMFFKDLEEGILWEAWQDMQAHNALDDVKIRCWFPELGAEMTPP